MYRPTREEETWLLERIATRSSCVRRRIGAAIYSRDGVLLATGFNHPEDLVQTCADDCPRARSSVPAYSSYKEGPGRCIAIHAEDAAIRKTSPEDLRGAVMIVTAEPCLDCQHLIWESGLDSWKVVS